MASIDLEQLEASPEPRALVDDQLRVLAASRGYLTAIGLPREQVVGHLLMELPPYAGAMYAELERNNEHLRVALMGARALSWEWDINSGRGQFFSEDFATFYGVSQEEFEQHGWRAGIHPDDRERLQNEHPQLEPDKDWVVEFRGLDRPGGPRWFSMRGKVLKRSDRMGLRLVGVTWDVTERHRMQEERAQLEQRIQETQRLESLGVLAGGIAHDFNNILLAILGNANLARLSADGGKDVSNHLEQIEEGAMRAADLCKQLLAYAGRGRLVLVPTDINQLVDDTVHLLKVSVDRNVTLSLTLAANLPSVVADLTQLRQVLMNLMINASEATRDKGGTVAISTGILHAHKHYLDDARLSGELAPGEYVFLDVSDTGEGMSPETLARIFEPFFTTKFTGRGLGLSAVLGIVRAHKGALQVKSAPGVGSAFKLLLPAVNDPPSRTHRVPRSLSHLGNGETILVVDDEESVRSVTTLMLKALGFATLTAGDGNEALQVYETQRERIACVVMDLTMPNPGGLETYRAFRLRQPDLPVLLMSGYAEEDAGGQVAEGPLTGFLQKPFKLDDLREQLRGLLYPKR